ncbi:MAG: tRNA (N6-isopentenyl adenosine(37)-C2)-methylthiotransferase MiaB [Clostridia bacterium]|nr:tRNA (N6-isopentenyl adenosine(37)-C2)-methylthiotransferase MiaB [Clostridia bacterium]
MVLDAEKIGVFGYAEEVKKLNIDSPRRYFVFTFGCQQNEADSEKLRGMAEEMGYARAESADEADIIVVNTCAIREHAEMKVLSLLGSFKAYKKLRPELIVGVCGCMSAEPHMAEKLKRDFHYVSFTLEPGMIHRFPELVYHSLVDRRRSFVFGEDGWDIVEGLPTVRTSSHRAWVSIMYGCNNFCSYCIVPYVRGRERSRPSEAIIEECRALISEGVKDITLLGQNVNSYFSDTDFSGLLSKIAELPGDFLIRFMTSHPKDTSDSLISTMARYKEKIAPYFHLPLQSGSNSVLRRMNRTYTRERFVEIAERLRAEIPGIALSTDVIVGFPGESEEDFSHTLQVLRDVKFDMVYAFIYSERKGTLAVELSDKVPREIASRRLDILLRMQDPISYEANLGYLGTAQRVLTDSAEERDGRTVYTGRTSSNKLVHFTGENVKIGEFTEVIIEKTGAFDLIGAEKRG